MPCLKDHDHRTWPTSGLHELRIEQCETQCGWCGYKTVSANNLRAHARRHLASDSSLKEVTIVKGKAGRSRVRMTTRPIQEILHLDVLENTIVTPQSTRLDGSRRLATVSRDDITRDGPIRSDLNASWMPLSGHSRVSDDDDYEASAYSEGSISQKNMSNSLSQEVELAGEILSVLRGAATNPGDGEPKTVPRPQPLPLVSVLMKTPFGQKEVLVEQDLVNDVRITEYLDNMHNDSSTEKPLSGTYQGMKLGSIGSSSSSSANAPSGDIERTFSNSVDFSSPSLDLLSSAATLSELSNRPAVTAYTDYTHIDLNWRLNSPKPTESYLRAVPNKHGSATDTWVLGINPQDCIIRRESDTW